MPTLPNILNCMIKTKARYKSLRKISFFFLTVGYSATVPVSLIYLLSFLISRFIAHPIPTVSSTRQTVKLSSTTNNPYCNVIQLYD